MTVAGSLKIRSMHWACWVVLSILATTKQVHADTAWVALPADLRFRIHDDGSKQELRVPVTLTEVDASAVSLRIIAVRRDATLLPGPQQAFSVAPDLSGVEGGMQHLVLTAYTALASNVGTYEVWVEARATAVADAGAQKPVADVGAQKLAPAPVLLKLELEHPAAMLRIPPVIPMEIVRGVCGDDVAASPLEMELTSDASRLSSIVLGKFRFSSARPITGTVTIEQEGEPKPAECTILGLVIPEAFVHCRLENASGLKIEAALPVLTPQKPIRLKLGAKGEFPLGTVEADGEIRAPQLTAPAAFKLSIKTRRTLLWLWLVVVAGMALGFVSKVWLELYLQTRAAVLEGLRVQDQVAAQLQLQRDPQLTAALEEPSRRLSEAIEAGEASEVTARANEAKSRLNEAMTALQNARVVFKGRIDAWLKLGAPEQRHLPPSLQTALTSGVEGFRAAAAQMGMSIEQASTRLDETEATLKHQLEQVASTWQQRTTVALGRLSQPEVLSLPRQVAVALSQRAAVVRAEVEALVTAVQDDRGASALLQQLERLRIKLLIGVVEPTMDDLDACVSKFITTLDRITKEQERQLRGALGAAQEKLGAGLVEERLDALAPGKSEELQQLSMVFRAILIAHKTPETKMDEILESADYLAAARQVVASRRSGDAKLSANELVAVPRGQDDEGPSGAAVARSAERFITGSGAVELTALPVIPPPADVRVSIVRTKKEIRLAQLVQTACVGVAFLLVAHTTYADKYVGTSSELIAIFFWAFSADVTVAKLMEMAKAMGGGASRS